MMNDNPFSRHKVRTLSLLLILLLMGCLLFVYRENLTQEALMEFSEDLPVFLVLSAFLILPLFGISLRILLVLVGFRFGFVWGGVIAGLGLLFHSIAAYYITRGTFREPVRDFLKKRGYATPSIPAKHRIWFTAVIAAVPGPPYFAKLYLLALTDLPFRIYVGIGTPIYILLSFVPVGIGSAVTDFDPKWVYLLTAAFVLTLILGYWMNRRFSAARLLKNNSSEGG